MKNIILQQRQILLFIVAGALSACLEIGFFKLLSVNIPKAFAAETNFYGIKYPLSNILSTGTGIFSNYWFSIWFVFVRGKHSKRREFAYFIIISVISTLLSLIFFQIFFHFVFTEPVDFYFYVFSPQMFSKIAAIVTVSVLNYTLKKKVIFNG